jgi:hypothetical protein
MTDPVTPEIRSAAHKAAWPPVPPEAVAAAESHALHGHVMWLLCASKDPEPSKITKDQRRQLIARLLELGAPAIRAEAAAAEGERCIALAEQILAGYDIGEGNSLAFFIDQLRAGQ